MTAELRQTLRNLRLTDEPLALRLRRLLNYILEFCIPIQSAYSTSNPIYGIILEETNLPKSLNEHFPVPGAVK